MNTTKTASGPCERKATFDHARFAAQIRFVLDIACNECGSRKEDVYWAALDQGVDTNEAFCCAIAEN